MSRISYAPAYKQVPHPCSRDCAGREPGCAAMCCTWGMYVAIRNHIYTANRKADEKLKLNEKSMRSVTKALNRAGRRKRRCRRDG